MILGQGNFALSNSGGSNYFANTSEWKSAEVISRILFSPQLGQRKINVAGKATYKLSNLTSLPSFL